MRQNQPQRPEIEGAKRTKEHMDNDNLMIVMEKAPKAFTGQHPLSKSQTEAIEFLIAAKKAYHNVKEAEEWEILPKYIEQVISSFRLVTSFLGYPETIKVFDHWNLYKEKKVAKIWAEKAPEKPENTNSVQVDLEVVKEKIKS